MKINQDLQEYIENNIFPLYEKNEEGHQINHIKYVIERSFKFARSIYGKIVSTADRNNTVNDCLKRSYTYGREHTENLSDEELFERAYKHLNLKFGNNGYAKFYFKDLEYEKFLNDIRKLLENKENFINTQREYIKELKKDGIIK